MDRMKRRRKIMEVYNHVADDVDCATDGCGRSASTWVTNGRRAFPVCDKCRDELTEVHGYKELRVH